MYKTYKFVYCKLSHNINAFYSEYNEFLDELEEDPELRQNINIFRDIRKHIPVDTNEIDPSIPQITLDLARYVSEKCTHDFLNASIL